MDAVRAQRWADGGDHVHLALGRQLFLGAVGDGLELDDARERSEAIDAAELGKGDFGETLAKRWIGGVSGEKLDCRLPIADCRLNCRDR